MFFNRNLDFTFIDFLITKKYIYILTRKNIKKYIIVRIIYIYKYFNHTVKG